MSEKPDTTLDSLGEQSFKDFKIVVVYDEGKGANWARNKGFKQCDTEFVLFSDNDINWSENALEVLYETLQRFRFASYAYGRFKVGDIIWGHQMFDPIKLLTENYISTMSLIRSDDFRLCGGFDESIKGFQDWDLFLNLLINHKKRGVYCNELIFTTEPRQGISAQRDNLECGRIINDKYNLKLPRFTTGYL
ncbi:MAG: glycosyltransferase family A protein [Patescibacteria group bacterium]